MNRGALLQAYSLVRVLNENIKNSDVEIIDYRTLSKELKRVIGGYIHKRIPIEVLNRLIDYNTCTNFYNKENILSPKKIITNNHEKATKFLKKQNYDMIVVGSDVVWNVKEKKGVFPTTRPFPNAYFLNQDLNSFKVSYAAAVGGTKYENLSKNKIKVYKRHLSSFDKISVRDQHTENFLKKLGLSNVTCVPDPTILIDLPEPDPSEILTRLGLSLDEPILAINRCGKLTKKIIEIYKEKGYQIVAPYKDKDSDVDLFTNITPFEYYSVHGYFDFVISKSLHTTIFSIKNGTPFATLDFSSPDLIDKKETLLEEFSLLDRHIKVEDQNTESIINKLEECEKELDKKHIEKRVDSMKERGFAFIQELEEMLEQKNK